MQLDLSKAFDRVTHTAVIRALKLQGCSLQCLAVICAILSQSVMSVSLGHVTAPGVHMNRGLPQGAPESPLLFVLVTELVLRPLLRRWKARGSGWSLDDFWCSAVCYADDILLASYSKSDLEQMAQEVVDAFAAVGLDVSPGKCHWTSYPAQPGESFDMQGGSLQWEPQLKFVGTILKFIGNDGYAIEQRLAQADKVYYKWKPFSQCKDVSMHRRLTLLLATVFSSALWLAETWLPTRQQRKHFNSWGARMASRVGLAQRKVVEEMGQYWRRLHRTGHRWLRSAGGGLDWRRAARVHSYAGHIARTSCHLLEVALRTRCLAWWRYNQARYHSRHDGLHPRRFKAWRWESQLVEFYGDCESSDAFANAGWMLKAQSRDAWKASAQAFLKAAVGSEC